MMAATKTIGITVKIVLELDEYQAQRLFDTLPSDVTIGSERLRNLRVGINDKPIEPVRISLMREDMPSEEEDDFLENC